MAKKRELPILDQWALWATHEQSIGRTTINAYLATLRALARFAEDKAERIETLTHDDLELFLAMRRHYSNSAQNNSFYALQTFYRFLKQTGRRPDDPVENVTFKKLRPARRQPRAVGQLSQKLAKLAPHHQETAAFAMELMRSGLTLLEIFSIDEEPPVPPEVRVTRGRGDTRYIAISAEAQRRLNEWGGKPPIGVRAFQRAVEKVGISPKMLGERSRSSVDVELHPILEGGLHAHFAAKEFDDALAKTYFEVRQLLRHLKGDPDYDSSVDLKFIQELSVEEYLPEAEADNFRLLLAGALGVFGDRLSREHVVRGESTLAKEGVLLGDLLVRVLQRWLETQALRLVSADLDEAVPTLTEAELRRLGPLEFQNWVVQRFRGTLAPTFTGDMGIDGLTRFGEPIQVKRSDRVGRHEVDRFETAVERTRKPKGYMVAFSFTEGAEKEARRATAAGKVDVRLVTVADLLKKVPL